MNAHTRKLQQSIKRACDKKGDRCGVKGKTKRRGGREKEEAGEKRDRQRERERKRKRRR
jgi:hypothetical protein